MVSSLRTGRHNIINQVGGLTEMNWFVKSDMFLYFKYQRAIYSIFGGYFKAHVTSLKEIMWL